MLTDSSCWAIPILVGMVFTLWIYVGMSSVLGYKMMWRLVLHALAQTRSKFPAGRNASDTVSCIQ